MIYYTRSDSPLPYNQGHHIWFTHWSLRSHVSQA